MNATVTEQDTQVEARPRLSDLIEEGIALVPLKLDGSYVELDTQNRVIAACANGSAAVAAALRVGGRIGYAGYWQRPPGEGEVLPVSEPMEELVSQVVGYRLISTPPPPYPEGEDYDDRDDPSVRPPENIFEAVDRYNYTHTREETAAWLRSANL